MRKSALLFAAAVLALGLPTAASAAPKKMAAPQDPNANSKKFVGDWVGQILVPGQSLTKPAAAPEKAKPAKKKKAAKAKPMAEKKKA